MIVSSYKYLGINIHYKLNWNYRIEKKVDGGWKDYYGLENIVINGPLAMG
jgi:hypothetical protein